MSIQNIAAYTIWLIIAVDLPLQATDWPSWRGPQQNGVAGETGLVTSWSVEGDNLHWRANFIGRSTPVVLNGRVFAIGRMGEGIERREVVACYDADSGELFWEYAYNVFHTTIPFNRVGWASPAADPETGYVYSHGVGGLLFCFDRDGNIIWSRSLTEEFGRISGYGGRVHTPVIDEDLVIISFLNSSWGDQVPGRHRYFAFDKSSGILVWSATPGGPPKDTTYSVPFVAEIAGQRLLVAGNADGRIYALKVRTGEKVWEFAFSRRGLNSSVIVVGNRVYATHGEENLDNTEMGRVVCIDGTGSGDVTSSHEVWRHDGLIAGYTSPTAHSNRLYVVDNSANIHCLDINSGASIWRHSVGTVGKGSPVWGEGHLYVPEVNGVLAIVRPDKNSAMTVDLQQITMADGRPAEIYGSPAIAYGRLYLATEAGLFCLGTRETPFTVAPSDIVSYRTSAPKGSPVKHLQIVPDEAWTQPNELIRFSAIGFDDRGRRIGPVAASWSEVDLTVHIDDEGRIFPDSRASGRAGLVIANVAGVQASARLRVIPALPWSENFETVEPGSNPPFWLGAGSKFKVRRVSNNHVLTKPPSPKGLHRSNVYLGPPQMRDYTIQVDFLGKRKGRRLPDVGLISHRYTLDLQGSHQRLQVRSWAAELRMATSKPFAWKAETWYTMKMMVETTPNLAVIHGKVWIRENPEPLEWTVIAEDPLPNLSGSPGLYGHSPVEIHYDNLKIW